MAAIASLWGEAGTASSTMMRDDGSCLVVHGFLHKPNVPQARRLWSLRGLACWVFYFRVPTRDKGSVLGELVARFVRRTEAFVHRLITGSRSGRAVETKGRSRQVLHSEN